VSPLAEWWKSGLFPFLTEAKSVNWETTVRQWMLFVISTPALKTFR
jgi:hypothetical protein